MFRKLLLICTLLTSPAVAQQIQTQFYVDKAGNDANNDCTNSAAKCLTINHAVGSAYNFSPGQSGRQTINIGSGTWNERVVIGGMPPNGGGLGIGSYIVFNGQGHGSTTWDAQAYAGLCGTLSESFFANVIVQNLTIQDTLDPVGCGAAIFLQNFSTASLGPDVYFGPSTGSHIHAEVFSLFQSLSTYVIAGSAASHFDIAYGSIAGVSPDPSVYIWVSQNISFSYGFAAVSNHGHISLGGVHIYGYASGGSKCVVSDASIDTGGAGQQLLPGANTCTPINGGIIY